MWIQQNQQAVPDSCCKTPTERCGRRSHPSNIYKLEVYSFNPVSCLPFCKWNDLTVNVVAFLVLLGRVHYEIRGIHPKTAVYPWCGGDWNCISSGEHRPLNKIQVHHRFKVYSKHLCFRALWPLHYYFFVCFVFQLLGIIFTCCLYRNLEEDPYWFPSFIFWKKAHGF